MVRKSRNIIIYSDGTGQRGGVSFDERRSNIYKLYRATRCGPDSAIDPAEQAAFYDAGIGTRPPGAGFFAALWQKIYNLISQALGLGLTGNITDCYAALVRMWQPGDQIFLIGFSRGAYTVRCVGGVLAQCGLPTTMEDGSGLKRDMATSKRIAKEAVKKVYQHTHSWKKDGRTERQQNLLDQRQELAERFRQKYRSGDASGPNVAPYFIGVFDTVASLANLGVLLVLIAIGLALLAGLAGLITGLWPYGPFESWWAWFATLTIVVVGGSLLWNLKTRVRSERGLKNASGLGFHVNEWRMRFYDTGLNPKVLFARHAISIDEARKSFPRVPWGTKGAAKPPVAGQPEWFQQIWFPGCHSDIGGSYPEDESRLSDVALKWMLEAAESVGLKVDGSVMKLYPDPNGMQHDEMRSLAFRYAGRVARTIPPNAPLHPSVMKRFEADAVQQYDVSAPYRPENLRGHNDTKAYY
jgi:uncharacterized protein (DUF2235 family)